jgi:hypothetical protein
LFKRFRIKHFENINVYPYILNHGFKALRDYNADDFLTFILRLIPELSGSNCLY